MGLHDIVRQHQAGRPQKPQLFMRPEQVAKDLDDFENAHNAMIEELAEKVWKGVVVPVCKQFGFEFRAGMGTYLLSLKAGGGNIHNTRDAAKLGYRLEEFFQILDTPTDAGPLGSWMRDFLG